ncbi:S-adenosyl-L-methionine-dependent methyltransferase [Eremomyces bilateralis CBS 781.70]|uniref:S-adenosyl-L-methionine-dependent methyltransferase n=1 Tax=Eremomyces bilateralis CBS 781.70 TaxID=1392243 RepID=A0A6G1G6A8_9PEZI|nr:S-adenosyl-L-methionine-dependent methyltransferase [Eremomyces bilateralis CBS 781.70]KAF1813552.1 S-adenosyl-L-methionine-dependent methyltransferase [Eremomyces bilateralis CBS 781.70]
MPDVPGDALELVEIHDRSFQKWSVDRRVYCVPVDEVEEERLGTQHDLVTAQFGSLYIAPVPNPSRVLDCGYGQGNWAVRMAEYFEDSEVHGIDIYPISLPDEPENLELFCDDLNSRLTETYQQNYYDLIHSRFVQSGIKTRRWPTYAKDLARLTRRGGYVQMAEWYLNFQSDSGRLTESHALTQWYTLYQGACQQMNRNPRVGRELRRYLQDAGLQDIHDFCYRVPIGAWSAEPALQEIGRQALENFIPLLESHAIYPFTTCHGWTAEQVQWLRQRAEHEMNDLTLKIYVPLYVAWGRRP